MLIEGERGFGDWSEMSREKFTDRRRRFKRTNIEKK